MKILSCDVLIYFKVKGDHKFDLDQIFGSARNQIEGFPDNTSWYIIEPFLPSCVHISFKWPTNMDWNQVIMI